MDVKGAFLYGPITDDVYVRQPPGFEDPDYPHRVYKLSKALYGLHQAPRIWYETLSKHLLDHGFTRGQIDPTLFMKRENEDLLCVQVYVDDIIFGSTSSSMCKEFEEIMKSRFQMSSMGEINFFLGLQVKQSADGIFINQSKFVEKLLKKFKMQDCQTIRTPSDVNCKIQPDPKGKPVDQTLYRSMIGSLMYLTASRPDIMYSVCVCARYQSDPKESHLVAVKRIFRYLKGKPNLGLWYPYEGNFELYSYSDSDFGGCALDRKSTTGGCQFLGPRLVSWQCKKQTNVSVSTAEAEYIAASAGCSQVLWLQNQLLDYGFNFLKTPIYIDNTAAIYISIDALLVMIVVHDRVTMQSIQCDEPHRELLCCGTHRPEVSHEVSFELQGAATDSQTGQSCVSDKRSRVKMLMTTVQSGNEHVKSMPGEEVIDICRVTSCVTIQPGEDMLSLYSRVKEKLSCCMENLKFEPKHNLVACLDESIPETEGYRDMMRFIKRTKYVYAMCAKPVIYARLIKSFWRTAEVVRNEAGVTVSEEAIRTALRIDEDEVGANDELTVAECQTSACPEGVPGFDNFPSDIASPIVAIAENKPFNMSKWIMNGFVFNLVKGKRFKFLMYPRFLQLMVNVAYPFIRTEGYPGGILYTEDMNDLSYKKMSFGNVPSVELFEYMQNIANNEEEIGVIYHHISNGEIVNPLDLVDKEIDEDESDDNDESDGNDGSSDDGGDDSGNDGDDDAESVSEEAENVEVDEQMETEAENVEVFEPFVIEEPVEVACVEEEMVIENPKSITIQYVRSRKSKSVIEPNVIEDVNMPEIVDIVQIAKEVAAEVETVAQTVDDTEDCLIVTDPVDTATSSKAAENIDEPKESSPKVASDKEEKIGGVLGYASENLETFNALDEDYGKLKGEHEKLKADYEELQAECNTLRAEKEVLENLIKEEEAESSESDKDFVVEEDVGVSETPRDVTVYQTRSQRSKTVTEPIVESVPNPDEAAAVSVNYDKAEGKRKLDAVPEITEEASVSKKAKTDETVQIEPIQSVTVAETEVIETMTEETVQFEPVQTETAPMIEALDDLDDIDFTESEPEAEPEANPDHEIPADLSERFAYLEKMKYNPVYLNGLTVSQINEEYEKCLIAQDKVAADEKQFVIEMGEWTPLQESLNIDDLPPTELYHQNPEEMSSRSMRDWLSSRNYPYRTLKRLKQESLRKSCFLGPKEIPVMALPENAHKKRHELMDMFPSEVKSYNIPMDVRESWHKSTTAGDVVRSLLSKGQSIAELLDSMIVPEKSKKLHKLRLINHTHAERGDKCAILLDAGISRMPKFLEFRGQQEDSAYVQSKKQRKQKKLVVSEDMYLEEFSDEYFDKVTDPGFKVIDGTQATKPNLKVFYNQETFELKIVRNMDDWDKDMITLFSTFELKLLHPSYIDFLRSYRMERCKDKVAEADRNLFVVMIEVIAAASEKIRVRKALLNANLVKVDIPEIEFMRVTAKGTLEVQVKGKEMPYEFYANIDFAGLTLDSLRRMNACPILINESKPRQAKIA
ncbi:hypothetical protein QVD17_30730 [Tagetes erecta]|uniref:Reverse transcriptase Ty1/copia-type domain-containing protein n=1 Tax=Tagetes erecta TaxID=13708 RepID=A0AAD8NMH7_TARER|nr:hypothetical protein QVD17_30730 [Tagetes erecta]